jgi:hypothetical protein
MPALPDITGVIRCDLIWSDGADTDVENRLFFTVSPDATLSQAAADGLAVDLFTLVGDHAALWNGDVQLTGARVTDLSSAVGAQSEHNGSVAGTIGGGPLPAGVAVCSSFDIARRYRGGRPRVYLPWGSDASLDTPTAWTTDFLTNVSTGMTAITSGFSGMSEDGTTVDAHSNVSYYEGFRVVIGSTGRAKNVSTLRAGGPLVAPITGNHTVPYPASQRRRNRR